MKRIYRKPTMWVCEMEEECELLSASPKSEMNKLNSNLTNAEEEMEYAGGGTYEAR